MGTNNTPKSAFGGLTLPAMDPMLSHWCSGEPVRLSLCQPSATGHSFCISSSVWNTVPPLPPPHQMLFLQDLFPVTCLFGAIPEPSTSCGICHPSLWAPSPLYRLCCSTSDTLNEHTFVYTALPVHYTVCILGAGGLCLNHSFALILTSASVIVPYT